MLRRRTGHRRFNAEGRATLAGLLLLAASAYAWARLPLPPHGDRSVHDLAGVLDPGSVTKMERRHAELFQKARVAIVVITVPRLEDETAPSR